MVGMIFASSRVIARFKLPLLCFMVSGTTHLPPGRGVEQHFLVPVDRKVERSPKIHMPEMRRTHASDPVIINALALAAPAVDRLLHALGVPRDNKIRQQRQ